MIDYYFETGQFSTENKITHIEKCSMCDNCTGRDKTYLADISNEAKAVYGIIHVSEKHFGMIKTVGLIKKANNPLFAGKSLKWLEELINILLTKDILSRNVVGKWGSSVIGCNKLTLPIEARISKETTLMPYHGKYADSGKLVLLKAVICRLAKVHDIIPAIYMNDQIATNVLKSRPSTIDDLWKVDGISNSFMVTYGTEFMKEYIATCRTISISTSMSSENTNILIDKLKAYRFTEAKKNSMPSYCVYTDSVISDIVKHCPTSKEMLIKIKGFSQNKTDKYGDVIIGLCSSIN